MSKREENIIYRSKYIQEQISNINLQYAELLTLTKDNESVNFELFETSGLKLILSCTLYHLAKFHLGSNTRAIFLESSFFASTVTQPKLAAFTCVYENAEFCGLKEKVSRSFASIVGKLQEEGSAILWHPDFCYETSSTNFYHSVNRHGNKKLWERHFTPLKEDQLIQKEVNKRRLYKIEASELSIENYYAYNKKSPQADNQSVFCGRTYVNNSLLNFDYFVFTNPVSHAKYRAREDSVQDLHNLSHREYDKYLSSNDPGCSLFISIPILSSKSSEEESKGTFRGLGAFFIYIELDEKVSDDSMRDFSDELSIQLPRIGKDLVPDYLFQKGIKLSQKAKDLAIMSAKAAIMGRNMSHNIGSHVLFHLKSRLRSVSDIFLSNVLRDLPYQIDPYMSRLSLTAQRDGMVSLSKIELPFLLGLGRFLTYLQERQDFIATISSTYIPEFVSVNFKDFVVDNFLADKRAKRHSESKREENILLNFLVLSENVKINVKYNGSSLNDSTSITEEARSCEVSIPGGVLGRQAIYSILENIIRNAAKHGSFAAGRKELTINIGIKKDNIDSDFFIVQIEDSNPDSGQFAHRINQMLREDIIDEYFVLKEEHKGIKEIKISSIWLRRENIINIAKGEERDYIWAESVDGHLCYNFKLFKSKKLAIITDSKNETDSPDNFSIDQLHTQVKRLKLYQLVANCSGIDSILIDNRLTQISSLCKRYIDIEPAVGTYKQVSEELYTRLFLQYINLKFKGRIDAHLPIICTDDVGPIHRNILLTKNKDLNRYVHQRANSFAAVDQLTFNQGYSNSKKMIAFRRHLSSTEQLDFFFSSKKMNEIRSSPKKKRLVQNLLAETEQFYYSIENITGDNSSIRFLHSEEKNDAWILKCIEAGLSKILIIDERIWGDNCIDNIDQNAVRFEKLVQYISSAFDNKDVTEWDDRWLSEFSIEERLEIFRELPKSKNRIIQNAAHKNAFMENVQNAFPRNHKSSNILDPLLLSLKQVHVWNYENVEKNDNSLVNKGMRFVDLFGEVMGRMEYQNILDFVLCHLDLANSESTEVDKYKNIQFDYITVHQSVFDKIYNQLISTLRSTSDNVTERIFREFEKQLLHDGRDLKVAIIELIVAHFKEFFSVSSLNIHSGRSKPYTMPVGSAFIPFSGLEYGIKESKRTLLDIIQSA